MTWWRFEGMPTSEEWQAVAAVLTLLVAVVGAVFAVRQLRQGAEQLRLSAEANQRAADAAESEVRPYVTVQFDLRALPAGDPKRSSHDGVIMVVIASRGRTPAREVSLTVTPAFQSSGKGRPGEVAGDPALEALAEVFSGDPVIGMLAPGQQLEYVLDYTSAAIGKEELPQRYDVRATYWDATREHSYSEPHILDLKPWRFSIAAAAPIDTIARQMRRLNENLEKRP